jgi:hypothetical protein
VRPHDPPESLPQREERAWLAEWRRYERKNLLAKRAYARDSPTVDRRYLGSAHAALIKQATISS